MPASVPEAHRRKIPPRNAVARAHRPDLIERQVPLPNGRHRTEFLDLLGRVRRREDPDGSSLQYEYDFKGAPTAVRHSSGQWVRYEVDEAGKVARAATARAETTIHSSEDGTPHVLVQRVDGLEWRLEYRAGVQGQLDLVKAPFDPNVKAHIRIDSLRDERRMTLRFATGAQNVEQLTADQQLRLQSVQMSDAAGGSREVHFEYDEKGKLSRVGDHEARYDAHGHLVRYGSGWHAEFDSSGCRTLVGSTRFEYTDWRVVEADGIRYEYDDLGRRIARHGVDGDTRYSYDMHGYLSRVDLPNGLRIEYFYDGFGRLVGRQVGDCIRYFLVGIDGHRLAEFDEAGRCVCRYLWIGPQCVGRIEGDRLTQTYHRIHGGRLAAIGNARGELRFMSLDDPLPSTVEEGVPGLASLFGDALTGFVHAGTRWLDPEVGQFLTPDTWYGVDPSELVPREMRNALRAMPGGVDREITGRTAYAWCAGDPLNYTDPSGHNWLGIIWSVISAALWGAQINSLSLQAEMLNILVDPIRFVIGLLGPGLKWYWKDSVFNLTGPVGSYRLMTGAFVLNGLIHSFANSGTIFTIGNFIWARPDDWGVGGNRGLVMTSAAPRFLAAVASAATDVLRVRNPKVLLDGKVGTRAAGATNDILENATWKPADAAPFDAAFVRDDPVVISLAGQPNDEVRLIDRVAGTTLTLQSPLLPAGYEGQAVEVRRLDPSFVKLESDSEVYCQPLTFVRGSAIHLGDQVRDGFPDHDLSVSELVPAKLRNPGTLVDFKVERVLLRVGSEDKNAAFRADQMLRVKGGDSYFACKIVRVRGTRDLIIDPPLGTDVNIPGPTVGLEVVAMAATGASVVGQDAFDIGTDLRIRIGLGDLMAQARDKSKPLRKLDGLEIIDGTGVTERRIVLDLALRIDVEPLPADLQGAPLKVDVLTIDKSVNVAGSMEGPRVVKTAAGAADKLKIGQSVELSTNTTPPTDAFANVTSIAGGDHVTLDVDLPDPAFAADVQVSVRPLIVARTSDAEAAAAPANQIVLTSAEAPSIAKDAIVGVRKRDSAGPSRLTKIGADPLVLARLNASLPPSHTTALSIAHLAADDSTHLLQVTAPAVRRKLTTLGPAPYAVGSLIYIEGRFTGGDSVGEVESVSGSDVLLKEPVSGIITDQVNISSVELTGANATDGRLEGGTVLVPSDPSVELTRLESVQAHELRHAWQAAVWGPFLLSLPIPWLVHLGFSFSKLANSENSLVRHFSLGGLDSLFAAVAWGFSGAKGPIHVSGQLGADSKQVTFAGNPDAGTVNEFAAGRRVTVSHGDKEALNFIDSLDAGAGRLTLRFALNADIVTVAAPGEAVDLTMSPFENIRQTVNTWFSLNLEQLWAQHIPVAWGRALSSFLNRDSWFPGLGVAALQWIMARGVDARVPLEQEAGWKSGTLYTTIVTGRPSKIRVGQFARVFAFLRGAERTGISSSNRVVSGITMELPPPDGVNPLTADQIAAQVHGAVLVPGSREVSFRERRFIPMQDRVENVVGAFFSTSQPGTYTLKAPGTAKEPIDSRFGFDVDFLDLGTVTVEALTVLPKPVEDFYETERVDFDIRGDDTASYELRFLPGSAGNLGTIAGKRYTIPTLAAGVASAKQKVQIIARYKPDNPIFRGPGQRDESLLLPEDLVNLCEEHELAIKQLTAPTIDPVHAGTTVEFTTPIAPREARVTSAVPAGAIVNGRIVIGTGRPAKLQLIAPNNVAADTPMTFELDFGPDPAFRKTIPVTVTVHPAPAPTPTDPPFLPPVVSDDYLKYIQPPARGLVTPLINGRSSNGAGPDIDLTEPLNEMENLVKGLGAGDSVYLSAWFFEPATELTAGGLPGITTWGQLFARKAHEGVKIRILINDFDPISGMNNWLQNDDITPLNSILLAMPEAERDNLKYVVSLHPAHVGTIKSLFAGQGGRDINVASHHQKFMVVKKGDEMFAFAGGLDIESRKTPPHWSYGGLIAWHDLHVKLEGPITRDLEKEFVLRWNREKDSSTRKPIAGWKALETLTQTPLSPVDDTAAKKVHLMQMTRTVSTNASFSPYSTERNDVSEMYRRAINTATQYLYLENQYFRSTRLADWIVSQGKANRDLVVILVVVASAAADDGTNAVTEHGDYLQFQTFDTILSGLGSRARLYTMKNRAVHSKFLMVDDKWMTIGSANANVRSFELDSEINLSIADMPLVTGFRHRLWAHNLGIPAATIAGWQASEFIARWDAVAAVNAGRLGALDTMEGEGVLAFDYHAAPGTRHFSIPDALARLDWEPPGHVFAGPAPAPGTPIRLA